ncbi:MAG: LysM peptidoglycan-binding domain-containing protein [Deltaproteobacteria bacterium]|nr:LysM peptidoglycan-binding domain-containing protein [Deltaproteobacteria bacterium]
MREVTVKKGDTLSKLSKQFSGRGYYYPQILLFNEIKNPHRISLGQVIRVPVSHTTEAQQRQVKSTKKRGKRHHQVKSVATQADPMTLSVPSAKSTSSLSAGEKSTYDRAMSSFKQGTCPAAIKLIVRYPNSPLLPEATLSRAECYLKLSSK